MSRLEDRSVSASKMLKNVVLFQVETHIWSASQTLLGADLPGVRKDALPPAYVATLGSKKLIDLSELKGFTKFKRMAKQVLERDGIPFMGGSAIPITRAEQTANELDEIEADFIQLRAEFLNNYPEYVENWVRANPTWEDLIRAKPVPVEKVGLAIGMRWCATQVHQPSVKLKKVVDTFHREVDSLSSKLFAEVANDATDILKTIAGKTQVHQKTVGRLRNIGKKLKDLSFIDQLAVPPADAIEWLLSLLPNKGYVEGEFYNVLYQFLVLLQSEKLSEFSQRVVDGGTLEAELSEELGNWNQSSDLFASTSSRDLTPSLDLSLPAIQLATPAEISVVTSSARHDFNRRNQPTAVEFL